MENTYDARPELGIASANVVPLPVNTARPPKRYEPLSDVKNDFDAEFIGGEIAAYTLERIASDSDDAYCALFDAVTRLSGITNRRIREIACGGFAIVACTTLLRGVQAINDRPSQSTDGDNSTVGGL